MPNSIDFRADQIQTKQIIVTGSGAGTTKLLIYGIEAQGSPVNEGLINTTYFPQTGIGGDVFLYVSGAVNTKGSATVRGTSVFGGDLVVSGSLYNGLVTAAGGIYSHAEGYASISSGSFSHAEGSGVTAEGYASHAEGEGTTARGIGSHAEGGTTETTADARGSHAEGSQTTTQGVYSHAEGYGTFASGVYSHAEGSYTSGSGEASHVEGRFTKTETTGLYAHAEGYLTTGSGLASHAEGQNTTAGGVYSHAEGYFTVTTGAYSHAEGYGTLASGSYSHAEGYFTTGYGEASHTEGNQTTAFGTGSHAEGYQTTAFGTGSHAEGYRSAASGNYSHAEGQDTYAIGSYSHAGGRGTIASGSHQTVVGEYNKRLNTTSLFVVGNGTGDSDALRGDIFRAESTGQLVLSGGISHKVNTQAYIPVSGFIPAYDTYNLTLEDYLVIVNVTAGGPFNVNLPPSATTPIGTTYIIRRIDTSATNTVGIYTTGFASDRILRANGSVLPPLIITGASNAGGHVTLTYIGIYTDTGIGTGPTWITTNESDL